MTASTVTGPTEENPQPASVGAGQGIATLYVSFTQQLRTDTKLPRDREPCFAVDVQRFGLTPGYYIGRLAGSHQSLPVYEVVGVGSFSTGTFGQSSSVPRMLLLPGLTSEQLLALVSVLSPTQLHVLNNLTACQLQTLVQLPTSSVAGLTTTLNPTQLTNYVDGLTFTQLKHLTFNLTSDQIVVATSAYPALYQLVNYALTNVQVTVLLSSLTSQQFSTLVNLTTVQLQVIAQLTVVQLQFLTTLTPAQVYTLVGQLSITQLSAILNLFTIVQLQQVTNNLTSQQIHYLLQSVSVSQFHSLVTNLTILQLISLVRYDSTTITMMVNNLTVVNLALFLGITPLQPGPILGCQAFPPNIPAIVGQPSATPSPLISGYAPIAVDANTGRFWLYAAGAWQQVSSGSSTGAVTLLHSSTSSNAATIDATGLAGYRMLKVILLDFQAKNLAGSALWLRTSSNNGSSYDAGASDYNGASAQLVLTGVGGLPDDTDTDNGGAFEVTIYNPVGTSLNKMINWYGITMSNKVPTAVNIGAGQRSSNSAINAVRFLAQTGNLNGTLRVYGYN